MRVFAGSRTRVLWMAILWLAGFRGAGGVPAEGLAKTQRPTISGTVRDDAGEPVVNVEVLALRPVPGGRRLQLEGRDRTDDRGIYRIALRVRADDYVVLVRGDSGSMARPDLRQPQADAVLVFPSIYYPNAVRPSGASAIGVRLGEERTGIDITLRQVRGATIAGTIVGAQAVPSRPLQLSLFPVDGGDIQWGLPAGAVHIDPGARFSFANVSPGDYVLWAVEFPLHADRATAARRDVSGAWGGVRITSLREGELGPPPPGDTRWIKEHVSVNAEDLVLTLPLGRGARLSGRVVFDGSSLPPPASRIAGMPVQILSADGADLGFVPLSGVQADGRFSLAGVPPGEYELETSFELSFPDAVWRLRSIEASGIDVTGRAIQVGLQDITDLHLTYTDRQTTISGTLHDASGQPLAGGSVVVFSTNRSLWTSTLTWSPARIGQSVEMGVFDVSVLGGGEYFVAGSPKTPSALDESLRDPDVLDQLSRSAMTLRVGEGERVTAAVRVPPAK
jgi:hypothetical protein